MNYVRANALITFNSAGLTGTYQSINSSGLTEDAKILRVINDSDADITISYDGVTDNDIILANTEVIFDFQSNNERAGNSASGKYVVRRGQQFYVKGSTGTGNLHVSTYI